MLLIAVVFAAFPEVRNWPFIASTAVVGLSFHLVGSGRVYRPAVTRAGDTITCRFNPWREAAFYFVLFGVPSMGLMMITGASIVGRGSPTFWHIAGFLFIASTLILLFQFVRQRRGSFLSISPLALSVRVPGQQNSPTDVRRGDVEGIAATTARMRNYDNAPAVQITYQDGNSGPGPATPGTVLFGPTNTKKTSWLTVEQSDLLGGLQVWKDGDPNDPGLMDRVEAILRGQAAGAPGGVANL